MVKLRESWRNVKIGAEVERLTVIGHQFRLRKSSKSSAWFCVVECKCGTTKCVSVYEFSEQRHMSCGCFRHYLNKHQTSNLRHGESHSPIHKLWTSMKNRCVYSGCEKRQRYAGRGIKICDEWIKSYESFRDYAIANGYKPGSQIDRFPDIDGNYEPGNVRFVSAKENSRNRVVTQFVTAWGETKSIADWADDVRCRVSLHTLYRRVTGNGLTNVWNPESAISTPALPKGRERKSLSKERAGTGRNIKTIYEVRGLIPLDKRTS